MPGKLATPPGQAAQATNTLVVTQLPSEFFAHIEVLDALRDHFAGFGPLHSWAPIKSFNRAILVYYASEDAERVKQHCDGLTLDLDPNSEPIVLRVFRGDPTPTDPIKDGPEGPYLCPPETTKNFLISPPGSPPVGWEQIIEDPPNATPLAEDLISALKSLQLLERTTQGPELLLESDDAGGITVYVEDCDGGADGRGPMEEEDWVYGETNLAKSRWKPTATARPPMENEMVVG